MLEGVPGVVHAIQMIHAVSKRYNTSERMTSLFVKVKIVCTVYVDRYVYTGKKLYHLLYIYVYV